MAITFGDFVCAPFKVFGKIVNIIIWEILDPSWKDHKDLCPTCRPIFQQQSIHVQIRLKEISEKRERELHDDFQRRLKEKDAIIDRLRRNQK